MFSFFIRGVPESEWVKYSLEEVAIPTDTLATSPSLRCSQVITLKTFSFVSLTWEQRKLSEIAERVTRRNTELQSTRPLTISAELGLVDQLEYFNKLVASNNLEHYILLLQGEFAYNRSYSNGYPFGTVKRLERYESGAVSTLYITFKSLAADQQFLAQYYESSKWHREISKVAAEGARNHGLLNISPSDFMNTRVKLPGNRAEQQKIGKTLLVVDKLIAANERQRMLTKTRPIEIKLITINDTL